MENNKYKYYCFTDFEMDLEFYKNLKYVEYLIAGKEVCPKTGNLHFQGFVAFKNRRSWKAVHADFGKRHLEWCKGNAIQNYNYCSKEEGDKIEIGTRPKGQGTRTDLKKVKDDIMAGKKVDDICIENPILFHQYGRTLNKLEDLAMRKKYRTEMTKGIWYYGTTGVGKSHTAFENFSPETHYVVPNDNGWWDGYCQQDTVIFNDFRGEISYNFLLQLVDKWPVNVKRRNREPMPFISKTVIVTSSLAPDQLFCRRDDEDHIGQLLRRFEILRLGPEVVEGNTKTTSESDFLHNY